MSTTTAIFLGPTKYENLITHRNFIFDIKERYQTLKNFSETKINHKSLIDNRIGNFWCQNFVMLPDI